MTRASFFRTARRPQRPEASQSSPTFTLSDLISALAAGFATGHGIEAMLDRVEKRA